MPIKDTSYIETKKKAKFFTGGKPKDFTLVTEATSASLTASINGTDSSYKFTTSSTYTAKDMRELADHLTELADILDKKIAA